MLADALAHRQQRAAEQRDRAPGAAFGRGGGLHDLGIIGAAPERGRHRLRHVFGVQRPQQQPAAARADRGQQPPGRVAYDQKQRPSWRLLEQLEQRIGSGRVELVGRVDNREAPSGFAGGRAEERHKLADILDRDLRSERAAVARPALEHQQIGVSLRGHEGRDPMVGRQRQRCCGLHGRDRRVRMREHETRHAIGQRRLADTGRSTDQPGVWHAGAAIGIQQRLVGLLMAEPVRRLARMRYREVVAILTHEATSSRVTGAVAGSSRLATVSQMRAAVAAGVSRPSITTQRSGSASARCR